ncbi:MAG: succinate dehydrogenase assembly factor 2 [Betaproteobacteria bacterium]|jgi:succinate dehydrogenase flavin-adding protein (antitoxin of CptAB toxin-antitoxin module)
MGDLDRVRWRCRRGLLELDLILTRFMAADYLALEQEERILFSELLDLADNDLWDLIAGRAEPPGPRWAGVLSRLRAA